MCFVITGCSTDPRAPPATRAASANRRICTRWSAISWASAVPAPRRLRPDSYAASTISRIHSLTRYVCYTHTHTHRDSPIIVRCRNRSFRNPTCICILYITTLRTCSAHRFWFAVFFFASSCVFLYIKMYTCNNTLCMCDSAGARYRSRVRAGDNEGRDAHAEPSLARIFLPTIVCVCDASSPGVLYSR